MVKQEIVLAFYEGDELKAVAEQNGHTTFYRLKRMTKDEVAELLQASEHAS